ncbi:hypothetical protein [Paraclostridium bifermentans]|uniref:hypothetical protein n=1 Tax=Paraclostridium bifermentans TaxID=1490 RepID=UPI00359C944A
MSISIEFFFQLINIVLLILIPFLIYSFIKKCKQRRTLLESKVCELEDRVNNLENN